MPWPSSEGRKNEESNQIKIELFNKNKIIKAAVPWYVPNRDFSVPLHPYVVLFLNITIHYILCGNMGKRVQNSYKPYYSTKEGNQNH